MILKLPLRAEQRLQEHWSWQSHASVWLVDTYSHSLSSAISQCTTLSHTGLLVRWELDLFLTCLKGSGDFQNLALAILGCGGLGGILSNTSNIKLMVDLLVQEMVIQVLHHGIKFVDILVRGYDKEQLALSKQGICNSILEIVHTCERVKGWLIDLLGNGQWASIIAWYLDLCCFTYIAKVKLLHNTLYLTFWI